MYSVPLIGAGTPFQIKAECSIAGSVVHYRPIRMIAIDQIGCIVCTNETFRKAPKMRRTLLMLLLAGFVLSACAGGDTTVPPPPNGQKVTEAVGNAQVDTILTEWRSVAQTAMRNDAVKPETMVEEIYTTTSSLAEIKAHYNTLTTRGWYTVKKMTNTSNDQMLLLGYEHGTTALVVGAIDAKVVGGEGIVIYTLKGTK